MPNEKYEDEIREILNRMDQFIPDEGSSSRQREREPAPRSDWTADLRRKLYGYSSTSYLVAFVLLALLAGILRKIYPPFGMMAALLSVACLLAAIALPLLSSRYGRPERRWRGRIIDDREPRPIRRPFSWRYTWWRIKTFLGLR